MRTGRALKKTMVYTINKMHFQYRDREVMARQVLNAGVAVQMCLERGIDWLLHIDHDELFVSGHDSVQEHFARAITCRF